MDRMSVLTDVTAGSHLIARPHTDRCGPVTASALASCRLGRPATQLSVRSASDRLVIPDRRSMSSTWLCTPNSSKMLER